MKRLLILFFVLMVTKVAYSSWNTLPPIENDSTVLIKLDDIRTANLIFVEHSKLLKENKLLYKQIDNYKSSNSILMDIDSIRCRDIEYLRNINMEYSNQISNLDEQIRQEKQKLKYWRIGGITVSVGILLLFLIGGSR